MGTSSKSYQKLSYFSGINLLMMR